MKLDKNNAFGNLFKYTLVASAVAIALTACGGGGGGASTTTAVSPTPTLGTVTTSAGVTQINQNVAAFTDTDGIVAFPGRANSWDINSDFTLSDGGNDQFDTALQPSVSVDGGTSYTTFPSDQIAGDLTWYTPLSGAADGLTGVALAGSYNSYNGTNFTVVNGAKSAYLTATPDTRLQQTLNLSGATGSVILTWGGVQQRPNNTNITPANPAVFRVVLRDAAGGQLVELYSQDANGTINGTWGMADLTSYAGQTVVLSFEATGDSYYSVMQIDDVSVKDGGGTGTEYVSNGGFESDMTGWSTSVADVSTNFTSGVRTVNGLDVQRSFYAAPNKSWGRWVDVYRNNTGAPITAKVQYYSNLGSDSAGIIYNTPNTSSKALTTWDGSQEDRDIGMVYGTAANVTFTTATALDPHFANATTGSDNIYVTYDVTVPAGGQVTLVNFIVMDGTDTGLTATDVNARATEIDTAAAAIVNNFWADGQYRTGMTQAQIDTIANF